MDIIFLPSYFLIVVLVIVVNFALALKSSSNSRSGSILLGLANFFAGLNCILYNLAVFTKKKMFFQIFSSLYLAGLDWMLLTIMGFSLIVSGSVKSSVAKKIKVCGFVFTSLDTVSLLSNPWLHKTLGCEATDSDFPAFTQSVKPLFYIHLATIYCMLVITVICVLIKAKNTPREYQNPFRILVVIMLAETLVNTAFFLSRSESFFSRINITPLSYGIATALIYWIAFRYSTNGISRYFKQAVFDNVNCGLLLFDYNKKLFLHNKVSNQYFYENHLNSNISIEEFGKFYNCQISDCSEDNQSFICFLNKTGKDYPFRCDYKRLVSRNGSTLGYLMTFTDAFNETDILTGFQNWNYFQSNGPHFKGEILLAIIDINALAVLNNTFGRDEGDKKIKSLADLMREYFPKNTYFVRGNEANLIAVCEGASQQDFKKYISRIKENFSGSIQYAMNTLSVEQDITVAIQDAENAMKTKKLQDGNSSHSEILSTLVKALEECDSDTREHVNRTRELGIALGSRIGLSDIQQSNLSLLCLLHDIGKIAIPLEILNKPGKLDDDEWVIMRSHVDKGFQIASSSKEMSSIADMILHHHERWDGKGYPSGLAKEDIPLLSRMIAVIDAYDAMVNDRIYRPAMKKEEAIEELKRCAGAQFDPRICDEFIKMIVNDSSNEAVITSDKAIAANKNDTEFDIEKVSNVNFCRYYLDSKYNIIEVDENFESYTGYTKDDIKSLHLSQFELIPENDRPLYIQMINEQLEPSPGFFRDTAYFEHRIKKKNGNTTLVLCLGNVHRDPTTNENTIEVTISNIMHTQAVKTMLNYEKVKSKKRIQQWESQYRNDPITGLMNRSVFDKSVHSKIKTRKYKVLLLAVDIDRFMSDREELSHKTAEDYIILSAQTLSSLIRERDLICRIGGNELLAAIFVDYFCDDAEIYAMADNIYDLFMVKLSSSINSSCISIGAAISSDVNTPFESILKESEKMLWTAKRERKAKIYYEIKKK